MRRIMAMTVVGHSDRAGGRGQAPAELLEPASLAGGMDELAQEPDRVLRHGRDTAPGLPLNPSR